MRLRRLAAASAEPSPDEAAADGALPDRSEPPSRSAFRPWTWPLLGVVAAGLFLAIYGVAVLTESGQRIENLALLGSDFRSEVERELSIQRLAPLSVVTFAIALAGAVFLGFARSRPALGFAVAGVMVLSVVLAEALKLALPRPPLVEGPGWLLRNSFPSGTAAVAAAIALGLVLLAPDRLRWLGLLAGSSLIALVAHALQVSGWHRLSDVVGSTMLVLAVASFAVGAFAAVGLSSRSTKGAVHPAVYALVAVLAVAAMAVAALMLLLLTLFPTLGAPVGSQRAFHQVAFPLLGAGGSALVVTAFARALDGWSIGRPGDGR
jgi:membrane-associated phospholipid phosphatase